jgi:nicotinate-nucleotide pyrophosphorylase (carboxylating)
MANEPVGDAEIAALVIQALAEDVGAGDLTAALIPIEAKARARVISRESGVVAGAAWFEAVFRRLDPAVEIHWQVADGERVAPNRTLCTLSGNARAILTGERTALNLLQTLSATATATRRYVDAVAGTATRILDTRKTLPGLRQAQKYAVRCGGGHNHRAGLYDAVLIKENHIAAAGSIPAAVRTARAAGAGDFVEVEVENLAQLQVALEAGADRILLDNFDLASLREAVRITHRRARLEASGGITLETARAVAETGVDDISVGALTKDIRALDLSLRFEH